MDLDILEFRDGFLNTFELYKQGENIFDINGTLFPTSNAQSKWRFARHPSEIHLADHNNVYAFKTPSGESEEEAFPLERFEGPAISEFGKGALQSGLAQVHRSDPGSIYFTLQEGTKNPTYTFRHVGGQKWQAVPKKRIAKKPSQVVHTPDAHTFKESVKEAFLHELNTGLGSALDSTVHAGKNALINFPYNTPTPAMAGLGALAGGVYDIGRRALYNTKEENEQETAGQRALRYLAPAGAAAGGSLFLKSLLTNPNISLPLAAQ